MRAGLRRAVPGQRALRTLRTEMDFASIAIRSQIDLTTSCSSRSSHSEYVPPRSSFYYREASSLVGGGYSCYWPSLPQHYYEFLGRSAAEITKEKAFCCAPLVAESSDCNGSVSHSSDVRSEVTESRPQSTLPFKKRRALFTDTFPAKEIMNGSTDIHYETIPTHESFEHCNCGCAHPLRNYTIETFTVLQPDSYRSTSEVPSDCRNIKAWSPTDVQKWALDALRRIKGTCPSEKYQVLGKLEGLNGHKLLSLSQQDWMDLSKKYGTALFIALHQGECNNKVQQEKKKRTRRRGDQCVGQLWEFMFKMLQSSETNPSVICWEDESKRLFRIVNTEKLAHLWGKRKGKPDMTYAHMSRTMRNYRKGEGAFIPDDRKRVYGFGPKANLEKLRKQAEN